MFYDATDKRNHYVADRHYPNYSHFGFYKDSGSKVRISYSWNPMMVFDNTAKLQSVRWTSGGTLNIDHDPSVSNPAGQYGPSRAVLAMNRMMNYDPSETAENTGNAPYFNLARFDGSVTMVTDQDVIQRQHDGYNYMNLGAANLTLMWDEFDYQLGMLISEADRQ